MAEGSGDFLQIVQDITALRIQGDEVYNSFIEARETSKIAQLNLEAAQERSLDIGELSNIFNQAVGLTYQLEGELEGIVAEETVRVQDLFSAYPTHPSAVAQLNDAVPILFFPVRVETVFENQDGASPELWVRIFPDSIAVDTHEELLTEDEINAGKAYWEAWVVAANDTEKLQAWDVICRGYSHERAAWVVLKTTPVTLSPLPAPADLDFPVLIPKTDSWTEQPVTRIMPDAFVVLCYNDQPGIAYTAQTVTLPDEIKVGLDPNKETTFEQFEGDIKLGDPNDPNGDTEIDWLLDFGEAIKKGLGVRIQLSNEDYNSGFKRILVLGVKTSLTAAASQKRLEGLIDSHHYTDGFSLLKQGTPTNNTDAAPSGYSSVDLGNPTTHKTERKGPLFTETASNVAKKDGQVLCEALGIEYKTLYHIFQSDGYDIGSAMQINNRLLAKVFT